MNLDYRNLLAKELHFVKIIDERKRAPMEWKLSNARQKMFGKATIEKIKREKLKEIIE